MSSDEGPCYLIAAGVVRLGIGDERTIAGTQTRHYRKMAQGGGIMRSEAAGTVM